METNFYVKQTEEIKTESSDNRVIVIDHLRYLGEAALLNGNSHLTLLCLKGKASLYIDGEYQILHANDLLICRSNIVLEKSMISVDFSSRCMVLSPECVSQLSLISANTWNVRHFLENMPVLSLNQEEVELFCQYGDLLTSKLNGKPRLHQKELINALLQAFLYEFYDMIERFISIDPPSYTSAETLYKAFVDLLSSSFPKERRVSYYADLLNITPKYLSAVCKKVAQQTASEIIDRYVISDIRQLLRNPELSIKEIMNQQNFPSLSFFGKYVKKHLGVSPKYFREQLNVAPSFMADPDSEKKD